MGQLIVISGLGLAVCLLLAKLLVFKFTSIQRYSLALAVGHVLFIVSVALFIHFGTRDAQWQLQWLGADFWDMPVSLLGLITGFASPWFLMTAGTAQYALIGHAVDVWRARKAQPLKHPRVFWGLVSLLFCSVVAVICAEYWSEHSPANKQAQLEFKQAQSLIIATQVAFANPDAKDNSQAKQSAQALLDFAQQHPNDGDAYYLAHSFLGRIALREGDVAGAKAHLMRSAQTVGSPVLNSFGPDLSLASELLQHQEFQTVVDFLTQIKRFWKIDDGKIDLWTGQIQSGGTPDFSSNLRD